MDKYPGAYANSSDLARATPHVRLSRPTPPDNTEWFNHDEQRVVEPARVALCFDCQKPVEPGKGVQVQRHFRRPSLDYGQVIGSPTPCEAIVHPDCAEHHTFLAEMHYPEALSK